MNCVLFFFLEKKNQKFKNKRLLHTSNTPSRLFNPHVLFINLFFVHEEIKHRCSWCSRKVRTTSFVAVWSKAFAGKTKACGWFSWCLFLYSFLEPALSFCRRGQAKEREMIIKSTIENVNKNIKWNYLVVLKEAESIDFISKRRL